jgi:group I intron endonuclease
MNSGIYTIENIITKKLYVGYTESFNDRFNNHISTLNRNVHKNEHLQKAWNKYGQSNFSFEILITCSVDLLESEEHYWCNILDTHNPKHGYNIKATHPEKGKMTSVDKLRISNKLKSMAIRPIVMLDLDGNLIQEFALVSDAANYFSTQPSCIHRVLIGKRDRYKNYIFVYKEDYDENKDYSYQSKNTKTVCQYTLLGEFIKEWKSTMDIERELSICNAAISACCNGKKHYHSAGGYIWKYKNQ